MQKKSISFLGKNIDTIIRDEIKTVLLNYYKEQGLDISESTKQYWQVGGNEIKLKLSL